jgi:hypothetical protein
MHPPVHRSDVAIGTPHTVIGRFDEILTVIGFALAIALLVAPAAAAGTVERGTFDTLPGGDARKVVAWSGKIRRRAFKRGKVLTMDAARSHSK